MRLIYVLVTLSLFFLFISCQSEPEPVAVPVPAQNSSSGKDTVIQLPEPRHDGDVSIERSLLLRRSIRSYTGEALTLAEVSQLLWAAQGITNTRGYRTAPSAGALYPLEVYLVVGDVEGLEAGIYRYEPDGHELSLLISGDHRGGLSRAALSQTSVSSGAASVVFTAVYERTTVKYGERGIRYVHMEAGHAAQNLCLQVAAMDLGTVVVGAFIDEQVAAVLNLPGDEVPLYIVPVGRK